MDLSHIDMHPEPTRRNLRIAYGVAAGAIVVLLSAAAWISAQYVAINQRIEKELSMQHALLSQFDQRVQELERARRLPTERTHVPRDNDIDKELRAQIDSILARLDGIEAGNGPPSHLERWSAPARPVDNQEMVASRIATLEQQLSAPRAPPPAVDRYTKEKGQSEWGKDTAGRINWAYADASFFAQYGGDLSVDCRQTSCKAVWEPPKTPAGDQSEVERAQGLAGYEVMAVVAKGGGDIGPLYTASGLDGGNPRIEIYFTRNPTE